jgi:trk system potassium uptake protein TrkH
MSINSIREKINLRLFSSKETVLLLFRIQSALVAAMALGLLIYVLGFPQNDEIRSIEIFFMKFLFGFYILNYFVRLLYTFEPRKFIRTTWLELTLVILLLLEILTTALFGATFIKGILNLIGWGEHLFAYHMALQALLLFFIVIDIAKVSTLFDLIKLEASTMFIISFIVLITVGAVILMLPEMTTDHKGADWMSAFFTSTSASCVTGLSVVDVSQYYTFKGQFVIMVLIQLGGLNIITFATFFASMYTKGIGIKHQSLMQDFFSSSSLFDANSLLRNIITVTLLIEALGAISIFMLWSPEVQFESFSQKVFYSVFHSISAFNNAGFSLFTDNLYDGALRNNFLLHIPIMGLIFLGSLGFGAIIDIFGVANMRERLRLPWKKLRISTMVALNSSIILILFGAAVFYFTERNNTMEGMSTFGTIITSLFQSVTPRTAGFNTINMAELATPTLLLMVFLMFIGGSSGSTAGGIKTSTFTIILLSAWSTIRGKRNLELARYNIAWELLNKAFSIFIFSASFVFLCTFCMTLFDPTIEFLELLFEATSAFATVGLSTGITPGLSDPSKIILMLSMFVGRVGTLTLALALSQKVVSSHYKYPNAHFMVG